MPYRNAESRFALNPTNLDMPRSRFNRPFSHKTSFNFGDIIPFYVEEVLPGDTHSLKTSILTRLQTLLTPVMDNMYMDTYYFFVPMRLTWDHTKQFFGENTESAWIPETEYSIPQIISPEGGFEKGTIADYMGIPTKVENLSVNALPFRAYALICNEFFRDENLTDYLNIPLGDANQTGTNGSDYVNDVANGGMPFKASKAHDYFTSALPSPQKGPDVSINLAGLSGSIPVVGNGYNLGLSDGTGKVGLYHSSSISVDQYTNTYGDTLGNASGSAGVSISNSKGLGVPTKAILGDNLEYSGLIGDLSGVSGESLITINQLRQAFQIQKFYERDARAGSRYIEVLKSHFGVTSPDARLQRPEYLGGSHININVNQVIQTSETSSEGTPQGATTAYSLTTDVHKDFTRSFTEHGYIIGLCVARYEHTYQQGIERMWSRKDKFDFYWPVFANLGEQGILNKEIYAQGSQVLNPDTNMPFDDEIFGYQEAWAEYRYKPNRVSAEMRSNYAQSLDVWHLADDYESMPFLSDSWIREDSSNINRIIAVSEKLADQIFGDFYVQDTATRCMPVYSIPGLIDHH